MSRPIPEFEYQDVSSLVSGYNPATRQRSVRTDFYRITGYSVNGTVRQIQQATEDTDQSDEASSIEEEESSSDASGRDGASDTAERSEGEDSDIYVESETGGPVLRSCLKSKSAYSPEPHDTGNPSSSSDRDPAISKQVHFDSINCANSKHNKQFRKGTNGKDRRERWAKVDPTAQTAPVSTQDSGISTIAGSSVVTLESGKNAFVRKRK